MWICLRWIKYFALTTFTVCVCFWWKVIRNKTCFFLMQCLQLLQLISHLKTNSLPLPCSSGHWPIRIQTRELIHSSSSSCTTMAHSSETRRSPVESVREGCLTWSQEQDTLLDFSLWMKMEWLLSAQSPSLQHLEVSCWLAKYPNYVAYPSFVTKTIGRSINVISWWSDFYLHGQLCFVV